MNDFKLTGPHLAGGSFRKSLDSHLYRAEISDNGRERVSAALSAAIDHVAKKHDLSYGVGGHHMNEIEHFLDTKYEGRHDLKEKERAVIRDTLTKHYGIERGAD